MIFSVVGLRCMTTSIAVGIKQRSVCLSVYHHSSSAATYVSVLLSGCRCAYSLFSEQDRLHIYAYRNFSSCDRVYFLPIFFIT